MAQTFRRSRAKLSSRSAMPGSITSILRRGLVINGSGRLKTRFQPDAEVQPVFVPVPQGELINEHCAQGKAAGVDPPLRRDLAVRVEDALELFVQVFNRPRAQFVQDTTYTDAIIRVRIGATAGRNHGLSCLGTGGVESRVIIMLVAQHIADLGWQLRPQRQGL